MIFTFNKQKKEAKQSLYKKIEELHEKLSWIQEKNFPPQRLKDFFQILDEESEKISKKEWKIAPSMLSDFFNLHDKNQMCFCLNENIIIKPSAHCHELKEYELHKLLEANNNPTYQKGYVRQPMTDKQFYFLAFIRPFLCNKYRQLSSLLNSLS